MRLIYSPFTVIAALSTALISCGKYEPRGPSPTTGAETEKPSEPSAPLGSTLCLDKTLCSGFTLLLPRNSLPLGLENGQATLKVFNDALPNVIGARSESEGLVISVQLPTSTKSETVELILPRNEKSDYALEIDEQMIATAINESSSETLHAFAERSSSKSPTGRIKIKFTKISAADKKAAGAEELPQQPVNLNSRMGQKSLRGHEQEVEIAPTAVDHRYLSDYERNEIKRAEESKRRYPKEKFLTMVTVYFQDGVVKAAPTNKTSYDRVDESKDYCFLKTEMTPTKETSDYTTIGGVITLVTGTQQFGPATGDGQPTADFSQSSELGLRNSGAATSVIPGKGYNKFGNGRRDSARLITLGCASKLPADMTVDTITRALGERRVSVTYPRADIVEAYLDEKLGIDLDLGIIAYRWKRLDQAVGSRFSILKDIGSNDPDVANVVFQDGQLVAKPDSNGGPVCYIPNHLKAGTAFKLTKAWGNTVSLSDNPPVSNGAVFTTDNKAVEKLTVSIVANWLSAPAVILANPSLLDAQALRDCFGSYISITE